MLLNRYAFGFRHDSTSKLAERLSYICAYQTILGYALVEHQHTHLDSRKGLTCSLSRVEVVAEIINRRHDGSHMFCTYLQSYAPASLTVRDLHQLAAASRFTHPCHKERQPQLRGVCSFRTCATYRITMSICEEQMLQDPLKGQL